MRKVIATFIVEDEDVEDIRSALGIFALKNLTGSVECTIELETLDVDGSEN
jgi:hypothetical protein